MIDSIGPYEIDSELGRGGMGVVYRAHDPRLGRTVAIKALPPELASDPVRLERFAREARTLAQLNHPNLAGIHGLEEHDGHRYLVLEFVEGETLADRLDRGPLDADEAVALAAQIADGVAAAHDAGVVHRDLKPANIIVTPEGRAKVLDFGLARADDAQSSSGSGMSQSPTMTTPAQHSPTIPGAILGTAAYMSPEQARGRRVDQRTDVWSFGVVLYEMLVGASPFVGETASDSIGAVLHKSFGLDHLPPGTPASVRRVLKRCLQRDKELRFHSLADARLDLLSASVDTATSSAESAQARGLGRVIAAVAVLVALVGGLLVGRSVLAPKAPEPGPMHVAVPIESVFRPTGPDQSFFDINADGTQLAYIATDPNDTSVKPATAIYLRDLDKPEAVRLAGTESALWFSFDPTGKYLAFTWEPPEGESRELRRIAIDGRAPNTVFVDPNRYQLGNAPCWLGSDRLAVVGDDGTTIHLVNASGGTPQQILDVKGKVPGAVFVTDLYGDPDGRHLFVTIYMQEEGRRPGFSIFDLDTQTLEIRRLVVEGGFFHLVSGTVAVYFRVDVMLAARWDATTRTLAEAVPVMTNPGTDTVGRLSANGVLAYSTTNATDELGRIMSVTRDGKVSPVSETRRRFGGHVTVSPDGQRLAVSMIGSPDPLVFAMDISSGYLRRVTDFPLVIAPTWMPDGRMIVDKVLSIQDQRYFVVDLDSAGPPTPLFGVDEPRGFTMEANPSSDGSLILMNLTDPVTAESDIYAVETKTGEKHPLVVSDIENRQGTLSPDGRLLAYLTGIGDDTRVTLRTFDRETMTVGPPRPVSTGASRAPIWSSDGTELFWHDKVGEQFVVVKVDYPPDAPVGSFKVGPPQTLFKREDLRYGLDWSDYPIAVAPDGQTFYYTESRVSFDPPTYVNLILNWDTELERLLSK